jgi:Collagen triple helix repeat (20 copies)
MLNGLVQYVRGHHVALLALFVALGGTSVAATTALLPRNTVASPQVVNGSLQTVDLSKKALKGLRGRRGLRGLRGLPGPTGATGAIGTQGPQGAQGPQGIQGPAGTARAYAIVLPDGCTTTPGSCTVLGAKNVVAAWRPQNGFYCIQTGTGINPATDGFMAGVEWQETTTPVGNASAFPSTDPPPVGAQVCPGNFAVATERVTSGMTSNLVNDVAIWFAVT